jgi:succinoglycan biosynthesis protein ExoA
MAVRTCAARQPSLLPFISVIVPVRNEAAFIEDTLRQLLTQNYYADRFEVLVADGQSTDATAAIVRALAVEYPNLRLLPNPRRWSSAGRNRAIEAARGDIVVIVDGHCELPDADYLWHLADAFARSGADCVGRPQPLHVRGATVLQRAIAAARASRLGHHPDSFIYSSTEQFVRPDSVAVAYRRSVFARVGPFDESFDACEDVELNHRIARAGLRCFFTPRVAVCYHPRSSARGLFWQMARYGRGRMRLVRKHPETFTMSGFLPAAFLLGVVFGPLFAWFSSWLALTYAAALATYALVVGFTSLAVTVKERDARILPWLPPIFLTIHAGAGTGILQELVAGPRLDPRASAPRSEPEPEPMPRKLAA